MQIRRHIAVWGTSLGLLAAGFAFPLAGQAVATDEHAYGGWLYEGTCDQLSDKPVDDFGDLEVEKPAARDLKLATPAPDPIYSEDEDVDFTIGDLTGSPHAIVVRHSEDVSSDIVACGEITGTPESDGVLTVKLAPVNDSGVMGQARLEPKEDEKGETDIIIGVWKGSSDATPASSPAS
ncbi:MAG TPA: hypothetical protein VNZ55_02020 [Thermomicrobiales bacterium]|nr:hypothetical protein [Thermomicrobiales bacterium]